MLPYEAKISPSQCTFSMSGYKNPLEVRLACRRNQLAGAASRALPGYLCVNVVMMDKQYADAFEEFCQKNPKPCPVVQIITAGETGCPAVAEQLDIRTDLGSYDVIRNGVITESVKDVREFFTGDTVTFLIGSSVSFDGLLREKGYAPTFGPCIFMTDLDCEPFDVFHGKIVVTMRSFLPGVTDTVAEYTSHFPKCHGGPLSKNDHEKLGIADPHRSLYPKGGQIETEEGHDRLYWACGVTPSIVAQNAKLPLMIVHTPGHAMITDIKTESLWQEKSG